MGWIFCSRRRTDRGCPAAGGAQSPRDCCRCVADEAGEVADKATAQTQASQTAYEAARTIEGELRQNVNKLQDTLSAAREFRAETERQQNECAALVGTLEDVQTRAQTALGLAETSLAEAQQALAALPAHDARDETLSDLRQRVSELRTMSASTLAELAGLEHADRLRTERQGAIAGDRERQTQRIAAAQAQSTALQSRQQETAIELQDLQRAPDELEERRGRLMTELAQAEQARKRRSGPIG